MPRHRERTYRSPTPLRRSTHLRGPVDPAIRGPASVGVSARRRLRHVDAINTFRASAGRFTSFRVVKFGVSAAQNEFCVWFDSRQLHQKRPEGPWPTRCVRKIRSASREAVAKLRLDGTPTPRSLGGSDEEAAITNRCRQERLGSRGLNMERAMSFYEPTGRPKITISRPAPQWAAYCRKSVPRTSTTTSSL